MIKTNETVKEKVWIVKSDEIKISDEAVRSISESLKINTILAKLLYNRGYTTASTASEFLRMEREMLRNPFDMKDIEQGITRINEAIRKNEKITVFGDYDVDGVTSVCTLYLYLKSQGARVDYYIPNRSGEGYGVSKNAIKAAKDNGTGLIITVDTGVTANEEVDYAREIGVDFIVTDHHECHASLPTACAVINPHREDCPYPFKELAGVGVVFKLICAYEERFNTHDRLSASLKIIKEYADLVAIGTIADVMPIREENRIIVKYGLGMIENTERVGLAALIEAAQGKHDVKKNDVKVKASRKKKAGKITSSFIGFTLAPRINAAGRVRSATVAAQLFLSTDRCEAQRIAEELCEANRERQAEENKIMLEAYEKIERLGLDKDPVIVLEADGWHHGVIGIVSSRITEKYCRPSILVSFEGNSSNPPSPDDIGKGSGRSIKGLNLVDALCECSQYLIKFGGHELAAGLSVTRGNLEAFKKKLNECASNILAEKDLIPVVEADLEITFADIDLSLAESLRLLEPYGAYNPTPSFVMKDVQAIEVSGVSDGKHTRIVLNEDRRTLSAMFFSNSPESLGICAGDRVDILFAIDINEWQDRKNVQLIIKDIRLSKSKKNLTDELKKRYLEIKGGAFFSADEDILPDRDDFVRVYKFIQNSLHFGIDSFTHNELLNKLSQDGSKEIGYLKLKFIIMIFREMNIIDIDEFVEENYRFTIHYSTTKKNIEKSSILKRLRNQMR